MVTLSERFCDALCHKVGFETNVSESTSRSRFIQIMSDRNIPIGSVLVMSPNERFVLILLFSL